MIAIELTGDSGHGYLDMASLLVYYHSVAVQAYI